jgi:hypothetical protein
VPAQQQVAGGLEIGDAGGVALVQFAKARIGMKSP